MYFDSQQLAYTQDTLVFCLSFSPPLNFGIKLREAMSR